MSAARRPGPDGAPDLGLGGALGWAVVLAYVACNVLLVLTTRVGEGALWPDLVGLALLTVAAAGAALLPEPRLTLAVKAGLAVVPGLLAVLVTADLPGGGAPGYAAWHLGAGTFVLFFLAARGHAVVAWCGMAGLLGVTLAWFRAEGQDPVLLPDLLLTHVVLLVVGTFAGVVLRRAARQISAAAARSQERRARHAARVAETAERHRRLAELEQNVRPVLERLAAGHEPGPEERVRLAVLEAELRDRIRGAALDVPAVVASVRAARLRGVIVEVMDDGALETAADPTSVLAPIPGLLDAVAAGRVVIRILPPGREAVASVVVETAEGTRRWTIGGDGVPRSPDAPSARGEHHVLPGEGQPQSAVARPGVDEP